MSVWSEPTGQQLNKYINKMCINNPKPKGEKHKNLISFCCCCCSHCVNKACSRGCGEQFSSDSQKDPVGFELQIIDLKTDPCSLVPLFSMRAVISDVETCQRIRVCGRAGLRWSHWSTVVSWLVCGGNFHQCFYREIWNITCTTSGINIQHHMKHHKCSQGNHDLI